MQRRFYIFVVKDEKKNHFFPLNQFQTMEVKRTWDSVKKAFQVIVS